MSDEKIVINDDFLLSQGQTLFQQMRANRIQTDERRVKDLQLYEGEFSATEKNYSEFLGANRLFINKTYTYTQRILTEIIDTVYFDPDEIVGVSSDKDVPFEAKEAVRALLNYRLNCHPVDFYKEMYDSGLDAIRNMICVMKVYPKIKTKEVPRVVEVRVEGEPESYLVEHPTEKDEVVESYSPAMETIPPEDVYFHPSATWKDYWQYPIIHRYTRSRDQLRRMGYKNLDDIEINTDKTLGETVKSERFKAQSPFTPLKTIKQQDQLVVYEMWDLLPGKDGLLESGSYVLLGDASGPVVVGREWQVNDLPYKFDEFEYNRPPFVVGVAYPESHKLEGKSFPWITESLQKETNAQRNQEREAVARALRPLTYINRDANVDLMALVNRRIGSYVQGDLPAPEAIQELPTMNPMAITSGHQARTDNDYYEAGIPPNLVGSSQGDDTATEATQRLSNATKKISFVIKNLAYTCYVPAFKMLLRLDQTYATDQFVNMVTGKILGWRNSNDAFPSRELIQGDFDFKLSLGVGKQAQLNKLMLMADRMNQTNQVLGQLIQMGVVDPTSVQFGDPSKVFDRMLQLTGNKDIDNWKLPAQQPPAPAQAKGAPSLPNNAVDPSQEIAQMSPEASGVLNVI